MLLLILTAMLNSNTYAMSPDQEEIQDHFSRLPAESVQHIFSFLPPKEIGQNLSTVNHQFCDNSNSEDLWLGLCKSEGWTSKPGNLTWKQYFSDQHKKNIRIVRLSVVQAIDPLLSGIERIEVKFNGRTYACPYTYYPDERPENAEVIEDKGKTYVRTLLAERVKLYRSEFQNPVPYTYTIYSIYEEDEGEQIAWQDLKNIKVREVTEENLFNVNKKIVSFRLNLPQDLGKGSLLFGYQPK